MHSRASVRVSPALMVGKSAAGKSMKSTTSTSKWTRIRSTRSSSEDSAFCAAPGRVLFDLVNPDHLQGAGSHGVLLPVGELVGDGADEHDLVGVEKREAGADVAEWLCRLGQAEQVGSDHPVQETEPDGTWHVEIGPGIEIDEPDALAGAGET